MTRTIRFGTGEADDKNPTGYFAEVNGVKQIERLSDLPEASGGTHSLEDGYAYQFTDVVVSSAALEPAANSPIIGAHGAVSGFVSTGGTCVTGSGALLMRDVYLHAPGGTVFDCSGGPETEVLMESVGVSDAAELGDIASLGTITGYRVPAFKGCNFEDFQDGITLAGAMEKAFFEGCPFRKVTGAGARVLTLDASLDCDLVKLSTDCYVKQVLSDTEVVHVESGGEPNDYLKLINVDLIDPDLQQSNIITGALDENSDNVIVADSFPLADSTVSADLSLDSATVVAGSGADIEPVTGATTLQQAERADSPSNGVVRYTGVENRNARVTVEASVSGANTTAAVYVVLNGTPLAYTRRPVFLANASDIGSAAATAKLTLSEGDELSAGIADEGGTTDLTAEAMSIIV